MVDRHALFDTNILIDHLNALPQARVAIERYAIRSISIITWMEVLAGANSSNEAPTRALLEAFTLLPITPEIAETAVQIRRAQRMKLPDAIILATAKSNGCVLITRNTRDFEQDQPDIEIPYRL